MTNPIYSELNINSLKEILDILDNSDKKQNVAILIKFGAQWCGPCQKIKEYCHKIFNNYPTKVICFDIDVDDDEIINYICIINKKK